MTKSPSAELVGQTFHFLVTGLTYCTSGSHLAAGTVSQRGDELVITDGLIEANTDRNGKCFLTDLHSVENQLRTFGREVIAPGPCPEDLVRTVPGTVEHEAARDRARIAAFALADPDAVQAALADIRQRYGDGPTTSRSMIFGAAR